MQSTDTTDGMKLKATAREIATFSSGHSKDDPAHRRRDAIPSARACGF